MQKDPKTASQCMDKKMKSERSCGTVLFTLKRGKIHYLLLRTRDDNYCGFPKGHMETGETERETALRETWEETSIRAELIDGFQSEITYKMKKGGMKTVTYFPARYDYNGQIPRHNPGFEYHTLLLLPYEQAYEALTHENTKNILKEMDEYIRSYLAEKRKEGKK